jgi:hypothetical protein
MSFGAQSATVLAAGGSAWGGMVIGLVAAGIFLAFSTYIVVIRIRSRRKDVADD